MWRKIVQRISYLDAHHRLGLSIGCGVLGFLATLGRVRPQLQLIAAWDAYSLGFVGLAWFRMFAVRAHLAIRQAKLQHSSRTAIFVFVLTAAIASLGAVASLLATAHDFTGPARSQHVIVAIGTVVLSWLLVHTIFSLHYAYLYYRNAKHVGGLEFPGTRQPDYADFAYFSFVVGMTSQVSDVQISSHVIRKWALVHGLISFAFNAAILALSINVISSLL